jgi:hypothetical protein
MFFWNKRVAPVVAQMMTWEVTTAFDGILTEKELRKRFDEEFKDAFDADSIDTACADDEEKCAEHRVSFWPLISFNATDGRKHRYLVAVADDLLVRYRKKYDRCLPKQIALYAIADKVLRGTWGGADGMDCGGLCAGHDVAESGNLLLVVLWKSRLFILVFMEGRLCHWSEESGYGESFDDSSRERVAHFKKFLKVDELFANEIGVGAFGEVFVDCGKEFAVGKNSQIMDELFLVAARDPFWLHLDLDECGVMKPCEKRRWILCAMALLFLCVSFFVTCGDSLEWLPLKMRDEKQRNLIRSVPPVALSLPASHDLEKLAWAEGHRDLRFLKGMETLDTPKEISDGDCDSSEFRLLGIVGGRVALVKTVTGEMKTLSVGDSLSRYSVKRIGMNDVVMRCGRKEVRYAVKTR